MIDATLAASPLADALAHYLLPVVAITAGLLFAAFGIACATMHSVSVNRAREATKRELAAYVAEGSIQPEDAVRIVIAGLTDKKGKELLAHKSRDLNSDHAKSAESPRARAKRCCESHA